MLVVLNNEEMKIIIDFHVDAKLQSDIDAFLAALRLVIQIFINFNLEARLTGE